MRASLSDTVDMVMVIYKSCSRVKVVINPVDLRDIVSMRNLMVDIIVDKCLSSSNGVNIRNGSPKGRSLVNVVVPVVNVHIFVLVSSAVLLFVVRFLSFGFVVTSFEIDTDDK
jgi:hypothetical protein